MANARTNYDYHTTEYGNGPTPYGSGDPYYNRSSGYIASGPSKRPKRNWLKIAIPVAILVIIGAIVGGVLGSRASKNSNGGSSGDSNSNGGSDNGNGVKNGLARFPVSTDSFYGMPIYPSTVSLLIHLSNAAVSNFLSRTAPSAVPDWTTDPLCFLPLSTTRPTLPSMASQRSPPMPSPPGPAIPSALEARHPPPSAQTDLDLSLPRTSGTPFRISLPTNHTSQLGTSLSLTTPPNISTFLPSSTTWMVTAVSLTTPEKSR
jgi:hypothetical protein